MGTYTHLQFQLAYPGKIDGSIYPSNSLLWAFSGDITVCTLLGYSCCGHNMHMQFQVSPLKHGREDSVLSYSEGFSQSFNSGDAETQTPRRKMKDQFSQVELQHLSTTGKLSTVLLTCQTNNEYTPFCSM